jgi:hypothetical protein
LADPKKPAAGMLRRSSRLLDALEAGDAVIVAAWQLSSQRVSVPEHMRPGKCPNGWFWVTPDDVALRTDSPVVDRVRAPRRSVSVRATESQKPSFSNG